MQDMCTNRRANENSQEDKDEDENFFFVFCFLMDEMVAFVDYCEERREPLRYEGIETGLELSCAGTTGTRPDRRDTVAPRR